MVEADGGGVARPATSRCSLNSTGEEVLPRCRLCVREKGAPNPLPFWGWSQGTRGLWPDQLEGILGNSHGIFRVRRRRRVTAAPLLLDSRVRALVLLGWTVGWFTRVWAVGPQLTIS
jgi:hypothetical protein